MGEQYQPELAQDPNVRSGKILRINLDGSIPADNPVAGSPMYSMGHRNPQGLTWHPETGRLYASEHGQSAHDEFNLIEAGANYGWPVIEGDETSAEHPAFKTPIIHSGEETWAPSGITFVSQGPWKGQLLVASLRGQQVLSMTLDASGEKVTNVQSLFRSYGRIRNVYEAPGGVLYFMTNNRDGRGNPQEGDDKLIRLVPEG
ncbi:PQQ-dependent sugar dehydrogenase [Paenibacillus terrigena]|uniref:PQQ-dependent sugar dehydrogenase n=1 Tax=Paenibacillus terrigena TaxID=369333 RepID=UPI0028D06B41|nr:PQQ-dependent sugar dehydrogenase [Paenibacillus terrigena]